MHVRIQVTTTALGLVAVAGAAALIAGCSGSAKGLYTEASTTAAATTSAAAITNSAAPTTTSPPNFTGYCTQLVAAQAKVAQQEAAIGVASSANAAITAAVGDIRVLENGAPTSVRNALADLAATLQGLAPKTGDQTAYAQALAAAGPKLQADSKTIADWVSKNCTKA